MAWPSARYKTATNGGSWVPADMNGVQDQYLRSTGLLDTDMDPATVGAKLGLDGTGVVRRGKSIIAATESRTNTAYGTLTTPDKVTVTLPTDGLIKVAYQATWQQSVDGAASAAIFIGANQLKVSGSGSVATQAASFSGAAADAPLGSQPAGLLSTTAGAGYPGDVTTGQVVGIGVASPGPCLIFAAAGTYDVSVQFKASSGSVTVKNRKLWVWTMGF
jgi:hypothetical protein